MKRIGLTGGIGAGKSYIAEILEKMGYPVFYSDERSKVLTDTHPEIRAGLIARFGEGIYTDGTLNKKMLASQIFNSEADRVSVNQLIHPFVRQDFDSWCITKDSALVFNEAAILFETGGHIHFDATILVVAPMDVKIKRIRARDMCSETEAKNRIVAQWSDDQKLPLATYVIENDEKSQLLAPLENIVSKLRLII